MVLVWFLLYSLSNCTRQEGFLVAAVVFYFLKNYIDCMLHVIDCAEIDYEKP